MAFDVTHCPVLWGFLRDAKSVLCLSPALLQCNSLWMAEACRAPKDSLLMCEQKLSIYRHIAALPYTSSPLSMLSMAICICLIILQWLTGRNYVKLRLASSLTYRARQQPPHLRMVRSASLVADKLVQRLYQQPRNGGSGLRVLLVMPASVRPEQLELLMGRDVISRHSCPMLAGRDQERPRNAACMRKME